MKQCNYTGKDNQQCYNPVFGGGFCINHQFLRPDIQIKRRSREEVKREKAKTYRHDVKLKAQVNGHPLVSSLYVRKTKPRKKGLKINLATGEKKVFEHIWETRERKSFLSGIPITLTPKSIFWVNCFAHILPKGQYEGFRLFDDNIQLLTPDEHSLLDQGTIEQRQKYARQNNCDWNKIFDLKARLRKEYDTYLKNR